MPRLLCALLLAMSSFSMACTSSTEDVEPALPEDPCEAWKDAALRYSLCNAALVGRPSVGDTCVSDDVVASRGPLRSVAECARFLDDLILGCYGLDVSREAYRMGDDTVVFDYIAAGNPRPSCRCTALRTDGDGLQCADLVARPADP